MKLNKKEIDYLLKTFMTVSLNYDLETARYIFRDALESFEIDTRKLEKSLRMALKQVIEGLKISKRDLMEVSIDIGIAETVLRRIMKPSDK